MNEIEWVDVNDRLPDKNFSLVILCVESRLSKEDIGFGFKKYWVTAGYCEMKEYKGSMYPVWTLEMDGTVVPGDVVFWMPMPEPPISE